MLSFARRFAAPLVIASLFCGSAFAQEFRGVVSGRVTDQSGGVIPSATITLTNTGTNIVSTQTSGATGLYRFDNVDPGTYTLSVEATGFSRYVQQAFEVRSQADITIDANLKTGDVRETVTVEANPVEVEFNSSGLKTTVETRLAEDIARLDRNPLKLTLLNPAALETRRQEMNPFQSLSANNVDLGGATNTRNDILVDGSPISIGQKASYTPNPDAVAEVNVTQNETDAESGHSMGGVVTMALKSGTNDWHGSTFYVGRNPAANAMADRTSPSTRSSRYNIWGGTLGNPIKKNKIFNFASYEQWLWLQPQTALRTVPTDLERTGDFSQSLNTSNTVRTIYDPWTTVLNTATNTATRTPFTGNKIPQSRMDPLALQLLPGIMKPNAAPDNISGTNNFKTSQYYNWNYWNILDRADYYVNDRLRVYGRVSRYHAGQEQISPLWQSYAGFVPHGTVRGTFAITGNAIYTISPRTTIEGRADYHTMQDDYGYPQYDLKPDDYSKWWPSNSWYKPIIRTDGQSILWPQVLIGSAANSFYSQTPVWISHINGSSYAVKLSHQLNSHFMKVGFDTRRTGGASVTTATSNFMFNAAVTANTYLSPNTRVVGDEFATYLLGALGNDSVINSAPAAYSNTNLYAIYFQDDWKLSPRISLNLGLRYEYEQPYYDSDHWESRFLDLSKANPDITGKPPVMPAQVQQLTGAVPSWNGQWVFTSADHPGVWNSQKLVLMPRVGIAYRLNDKSAIRAGWARYVGPTDMPPSFLAVTGSTTVSLLSPFVPYYTATQNELPLLQGIPQATFANPFNSGNPIVPPLQQTCGAACGVGTSALTTVNQGYQRPVNDRFNLTFSRQLPNRILAEITYFSNFGRHYAYVTNLNMMNPQIGYTNKSAISANVANPFYNYLTPAQFPGPLRNQATVSLQTLLAPYPQYGSVYQMFSSGRHERYDSVAIKIQRPFANGYNFLVGYNYNYEREEQFYDEVGMYTNQFAMQTGNNPRHKVTVASIYQLPFGRGRMFLKDIPRAADLIIGGWQTTATWFFSTGDYLRFGAAAATCDPTLDSPTRQQWFKTSCLTVLPAYTPRTNPWQYSGLTGPVYWDVQANLSKTFSITERIKAEFKLAAYNLTNHLNLADPVLTVTDAAFGQAVLQSNTTQGRQLEYSLRLRF
jgi:hypothetical protein